MTGRLFKLYQQSRLFNINFNVVAAGLLAIAISKYPVFLVSEWIGPERKFLITLAAAGIDVVADVVIYYGLHWLANHWRPASRRPRVRKSKRAFFKDATLVQFERAILSPLYYMVAGGLMYLLQHQGIKANWAFVFGFVSAIVVTRVVHTMWGLRTGRFKSDPHEFAIAPDAVGSHDNDTPNPAAADQTDAHRDRPVGSGTP
ncbi:MAG: hypothetical protein KF902_05280 [Phycisphaeraceae bacterium]|nr:hypothetical protein [Phycisphaeraceae bacterium]MBX3361771.1 hypothetical protein [Phycisphaeraceae bacterium]MCW5768243.1 hypothetical protein [Phycisphaeraceae bacterium]